MDSSEPPAPPPMPLPASPSGHYDFILNPPSTKKKHLLPTSNSPKQRILIAVAFGGVMLIVLILVIGMLFGSKNNSATLIDLAAQQSEIIRVSDIGANKAKTPAAKNLAITTKLSLQTTQNQTLDHLKKLKNTVGTKELAQKKNTKTDQQLDAAAVNNKFDEIFIQIIRSSLSDYRTAVKKLYDTTSSKTEKQFLASSYNGAGILINEKLL